MDNKTKIKKILEYLEAGNRVTDMKAVEIAQSYRLSSIIYELRHSYELNIQDRWVLNENTGNRYKEYWLVQ